MAGLSVSIVLSACNASFACSKAEGAVVLLQ